MKTNLIHACLTAFAISLVACGNDSDVTATGDTNPYEIQVDGDTETYIYSFAPEIKAIDEYYTPFESKESGLCDCDNCDGGFYKIDLESGKTLGIDEDNEEWDIAIRSGRFVINGGEKLGFIDEPERTRDVKAYLIEDGTIVNGEPIDVDNFDLNDIREIEVTAFLSDGQQDDPENVDCLKIGAIGNTTQKTNIDDPEGSLNGSTHPFLPLEQLYFVKTRNNKFAVIKLLSTYQGFSSHKDDFIGYWRTVKEDYAIRLENEVAAGCVKTCTERGCVDEIYEQCLIDNKIWDGFEWPASGYTSFEYAYFDTNVLKE